MFFVNFTIYTNIYFLIIYIYIYISKNELYDKITPASVADFVCSTVMYLERALNVSGPSAMFQLTYSC